MVDHIADLFTMGLDNILLGIRQYQSGYLIKNQQKYVASNSTYRGVGDGFVDILTGVENLIDHIKDDSIRAIFEEKLQATAKDAGFSNELGHWHRDLDLIEKQNSNEE